MCKSIWTVLIISTHYNGVNRFVYTEPKLYFAVIVGIILFFQNKVMKAFPIHFKILCGKRGFKWRHVKIWKDTVFHFWIPHQGLVLLYICIGQDCVAVSLLWWRSDANTTFDIILFQHVGKMTRSWHSEDKIHIHFISRTLNSKEPRQKWYDNW